MTAGALSNLDSTLSNLDSTADMVSAVPASAVSLAQDSGRSSG